MRAEFLSEYEALFFTVGRTDCGNCGVGSNLHLHHIVPIANGGTNRSGNLSILCRDCHAKAHDGMAVVKHTQKASDLLTYENLKKWRLDDKLSYVEIADMTNNHFSTVAKTCRKFGITGIVNKDKRKKTAIDKIIDYFAKMESGERVKQSTIYKELNMQSQTFRRQVKTDRFKAAMEKYGITKEKTFYSKA